MTALPITLETALRHQGYTIDTVEAEAFTITVTDGVLHIPAMVRSELTWRREDPTEGELGADLYLSKFPIFDDAYRPVLLSHILDRYRTRRLGYNTPGEWMLAFRRHMNVSMTIPNLRYASSAITLPLDNRDETDVIEATSHGLDIGSDFPQSLISGSTDFASAATDKKQADNATTRRTGRSVSAMELLTQQRETYLNVDEEVLSNLDTLFLGVFDQGEGERPAGQYAQPPTYFSPMHGYGW